MRDKVAYNRNKGTIARNKVAVVKNKLQLWREVASIETFSLQIIKWIYFMQLQIYLL